MTNQDRISNLQSLGYTQTEARFLVIAALNTGHFVRRQFREFASLTRGGAEDRFIEKLLSNRHAEEIPFRFNRLVYRLSSRRLYEALGEGDNRNRRACQPYVIRHKLMQLDFVLSRPNCRFLPTLTDRLDHFKALGIAQESLPVRIYSSKDSQRQSKIYFFDRSPIFFDPSLSQPVASFAFINDGDFAYRDVRSFLADHRALFAALPEFRLVFVAANDRIFGKAAKTFGKFLWSEGGSTAELLTHFRDRLAFEHRETKGWDKARIDRLRDQRDHFAGPHFDSLYARWKAYGDGAVRENSRSLNGSLETVVLPYNYELFGGDRDAN